MLAARGASCGFPGIRWNSLNSCCWEHPWSLGLRWSCSNRRAEEQRLRIKEQAGPYMGQVAVLSIYFTLTLREGQVVHNMRSSHPQPWVGSQWSAATMMKYGQVLSYASGFPQKSISNKGWHISLLWPVSHTEFSGLFSVWGHSIITLILTPVQVSGIRWNWFHLLIQPNGS